MEALTKKVLKEIKSWTSEEDTKTLQQLFSEVLDLYIAANYPEGSQRETLMCSIHQYFKDGHNCVGCNLQEQSMLLIKFLSNFKTFTDIQLTATQFHALLYLLAVRYTAYIDYIDLQQPPRHRHFSVFQKLTQWANFLKHPKSFVLAHHPGYLIDGLEMNDSYHIEALARAKSANCLIDDEFVKTFYSGDKKNSELHGRLAKKEGVIVLFPNPVSLIKELTTAQQKFVELIKDNSIIREMLKDEATIKDMFEEKEVVV